MSFTVRRVEDPTIYVRRNIKPDIIGLSSAWDNIVDIKESLSRLEDDVVAANKRPKLPKNAHSFDGKVLKEISSETQQLGKVTRFQLFEEKSSHNDYAASKAQHGKRKTRADYSKVLDVPSVQNAGYSGLNQVVDKPSYSPTRYTAGLSNTGGTAIHNERPTYFETTTLHPTILNDLPANKDNSFGTGNTTVSSSSASQQFSVTSSPSLNGKAVLARNEAALEKIKEKVRKQKAGLSKQEDGSENILGRKLHESTDQLTTSNEPHDKTNFPPAVALKRKVGVISTSGPTYKGFNAVSEPKQIKRVEKPKPPVEAKISKDKVPTKSLQTKEKKATKSKMTRIVGSKRPQEVITTTSWREGQANVKRILNAKKAKISDTEPIKAKKTHVRAERATIRTEKVPIKNDIATTKTNMTYDVSSQSQDELSEGRLSSDEDILGRFNEKIEKFEAERDQPPLKNDTVKSSESVKEESDDENGSIMKDVLSKEAQSMLADLAQDSSESEEEISKNDKPKASPPRKKLVKTKKPAAAQKIPEDHLSKGKTRHYDQAEVQKYMAHQLAERRRREKQEKIEKKKQLEEKQQRLKDLYERQKKSFAPTKKDKRFGKTFSFGTLDVRVPSQSGFDPEINEEHSKKDLVFQSASQNESDKENTDIDEERNSHEISSERYTDDADVTLTEDRLTNETSPSVPTEQTVRPAPSIPLDQRAQRLTALQATALALQSRLQSHALRLSGAKEGVVTKPAAKVSAPPKEVETGFHGVLPGVVNIRKQADENEKQSTRVTAATKIQAAYRGHTVRKRNHWTDAETTANKSGNTALMEDHHPDTLSKHDLQQNQSESSSDDMQFTNLRPFYNSEFLNNDVQRVPPKIERKFDDLRSRNNFLRNDFSTAPITHFTAPPARYEPKGDRFSVMNIFSRRHPTLPMNDILNEEPGSETASLLEVVRSSRKTTEHDMEYEDDFTDVEVSTAASVVTDGELKKAETYSECFETDEESETLGSRTRDRSKARRSPLQDNKSEERSSQADGETRKFSERDERGSTLSEDHISSPGEKDEFVMPVMASTMQPDNRPSSPTSPSVENEPIRRRGFVKPVDRTGGDRLSPDSLRRKLTAEINLLENVEDSVRQVSDIERTRAVTLAQQETVALAQILKAKQQSYEQEMRNLQLKTKEEAFQSAKDLEKTRQAGAMAATSAAERLAEVQTQAIRMNTEHSRKYMEEAAMMTSNLLTSTSCQLAEFCKNLTTTTSAAVEELHKTKRPTTTLIERGTSISEGHTMHSERSSTSDDRTRSSDNSNQSKSFESSPSLTSGRQQAGYSSDEFESYKSQTAKHSDIKTENTNHPSLSAESIVEDLPEKSVSEDDTTVHEDDTTTVHDESGNDTREASPREPRSKAHDSVSSVLDYSSQFEDSSRALTDEDVDFNFLLPSREHRRKSIKRIKDISFDKDKGKKRAVSSPFESEDSFGKFTVDMMQQYMHEEKVRTKHQAAILRLREKSLEEKTEAELQWLEQMKKQSRNKGSDDVMPSIKKRERGIKMKLKAEKEEIKCLKAANRAASFQRRFMMYQQQEIQRLHQATLSIRNKIQKDTSKKSSDQSSHEPSQTRPRTSSPAPKALSHAQSTPSTSYTKSKTKSSNQSPSAKSVTEDITGEHGTSRVSPNTSGSPFPSYSTPKSEDDKQDEQSPTARGLPEPETSAILDMLSNVDVGGGQIDASPNGELLKIHKMLLERQRKLAEDESEVKSMLQKVTEMLKNQRNLTTSHFSQSPISVSDVNQSKRSIKEAKHGKNDSEQSSIPEDISSIAKSVPSEGVKESPDKTANDYENCTFDSDDSTTRSGRSTSPRMTSQNGEINAEEETSCTETSDHGELKERVRNLEEQLQREKKKLDGLERTKRRIERSAMKKEALKLENEIKNTRDDINRKLTEIKAASAAAQSTTPTRAGPPGKPHKVPPSPRQEVVPSSRLRRRKSSGKSSDYSTPVSGSTSETRRADPSSREEEESLIEVLDDHQSVEPKEEKIKPKGSKTEGAGILDRTKSETSDIPEELLTNEVEESVVEILDDVPTPMIDMGVPLDNERSDRKSITPRTPRERVSNTLERSPSIEDQAVTRSGKSVSSPVLAKDDSLDMPEEISEHIDSDSRSTTSIPEEAPSVVEDESKGSEIPEEISEKSYTPIPSDATVSDGTGSKAAGVSEDGTFKQSCTGPRSTTSVHEKSPSVPESPEIKTNISDDLSDGRGKLPHDEVSKPLSISERLSGRVEEIPSASDEPSYTEPESDASISEESSAGHRVEIPSKSDAHDSLSAKDKQISTNALVISQSLLSEDEISRKSLTSSKNKRSRSTSRKTEDEKPESRPSLAVSDRQPATRPVVAKPSETVEEPRKSLSEPVDAQSKTSSRAANFSPHVSTQDATESHSEASSISEDIASGYEDEDVKDQESEKLIFGEKVENEGKKVDETGLKESRSDRTESGLDKPGLHEPDVHERGASHAIDFTDELKPQETGNDVSSVAKEIKDNEQYKRSVGSESSRPRELSTKETEQSKQDGDEQQYSEDFEKDDASIPEDFSEIIEEFSEKAEDSNNEDFSMFISDDKTSQDGELVHGLEETGYETSGVAGRSHGTESRGQHAGDVITDSIYEDIIADSLNSLKSAKAKKCQLTKETSLDETDKTQPGRRVLTSALSTVTKNLVDIEGPARGQLDTLKDISGYENIRHVDTDRGELIETEEQTDGLDTERNKPAEVTQIHVDSDSGASKQTGTERGKQGHHATDIITRDLLADAIMQMIEIKRRKKEKNLKLMAAVETKPAFETISAKSPDAALPAGTSSLLKVESTDETAIGHALMIAKTNQILDTDALMTMDDDIAGLLGTPLDDEDEFPVNETNFSDIPSDEDEPSLPEYSPMFPVPHTTQDITPMVNATVDVLLEEKRLGKPLDECALQAQFLAGETDTELECVSIQSYRHLVFDLTKEVFIDTISQHEPANQPPWAKAKWKGGQKLSRNFKRWKSDDEIRAAVLERVTNIIGLGAPRATMATLPRKTPVRGNKKDNVDAILIEELRQEEPLWTDYEEDETMVKFQVADAILNMLLEDTGRVFSAIQAKKHVPDNVLVV